MQKCSDAEDYHHTFLLLNKEDVKAHHEVKKQQTFQQLSISNKSENICVRMNIFTITRPLWMRRALLERICITINVFNHSSAYPVIRPPY